MSNPASSQILTWKNIAIVFAGLFVLSLVFHARSGYESSSALQGVNLQAKLSNLPCASENFQATENRILVTGAAGFVGFHSSKELKKRGYAVVGIDNFNNYYPVSLKRARAADLLANDQIEVVDADINDIPLVRELFHQCKFTHILHLAAQAGVRYAAKNATSYITSNVMGTVSLFEVIKDMNPKPIMVYASSSSVYGLTKQIPFTETDIADTPASLYAATKRSTELVAHTYHHLYGISTSGLRFFTVYGPWGRPDMSAMLFSHNIMDGKPIKVFQAPDGSELARDFTFIEDIVSGIMLVIESSPKSTKETSTHRVFNLGNTHPVTVTKLVQELEEALGRKATVNYKPLPALGDVIKTHANISYAQSIGYKPQTDLHEGVIKFVKWFKDYYGPDGQEKKPDEVTYVPDRR